MLRHVKIPSRGTRPAAIPRPRLPTPSAMSATRPWLSRGALQEGPRHPRYYARVPAEVTDDERLLSSVTWPHSESTWSGGLLRIPSPHLSHSRRDRRLPIGRSVLPD